MDQASDSDIPFWLVVHLKEAGLARFSQPGLGTFCCKKALKLNERTEKQEKQAFCPQRTDFPLLKMNVLPKKVMRTSDSESPVPDAHQTLTRRVLCF